ncbi:hypothetical protein JD844_003841 [Phrynosoma platyrhinos]|uniref:inositol-phosphate phosphatase n=1 Tax=Phrynosoma platyrhinos TaxID=52577 RepID=A0ABQ7TE73_PHRPL|nr:hypothetical protein JD844_003841 [Phrynosoma platyrhinos]
MAPMGIRLSPLGAAVLGLLGLGLLYHLYSGFVAGRLGLLAAEKAGASSSSSGLVDLRELLAASVAAAGRGGAEVRRVREEGALHGKAKGKTREGADEMLTNGDLRSNRQMYGLLRAAFPGVQVRNGGQLPTTLRHLCFAAWAMVRGGSNVKPRSSYNDQTPTIIVSRSHEGAVKQVAWQTFGNKTVIIKAGGAGYKVLSLLNVPDADQEKADIYIHVTYIKKWDICAGNAMLKALGGQMTTLAGEEISYTGSSGNDGGLIASINMNHKALIEKLPILEKTSEN